MAKIVHITTVHPALDIRIFQKQCRTLVRAGHEVTLIAPRDTTTPERIEGVVVRGLPKAQNRRRRMLDSTREAVRIALEIDADLYHIHDPELLLASRHLIASGRPVVFDMHENLPKDLLTKPWLPRLLRRPASMAASIAQRMLLKNLAVILAEDSYADEYPWLADATVVRNMPLVEELLAIADEQAKADAGEETSKPAVGYMGSISPARGSLVMLEALAILRRRGLDCGLRMAGPIHAEQQLLDRAKRLGLDDVRIDGWLPAQDAWRRMAACRAGLALLADRPNFSSSLPTKMFEYMALGLPVVVSDFPLYRKIVEEAGCGLCVDPTDPEAIADAISHLLKNPQQAAAMGRRGRRAVVETYRWEEEAAKLLGLYERLLGDVRG